MQQQQQNYMQIHTLHRFKWWKSKWIQSIFGIWTKNLSHFLVGNKECFALVEFNAVSVFVIFFLTVAKLEMRKSLGEIRKYHIHMRMRFVMVIFLMTTVQTVCKANEKKINKTKTNFFFSMRKIYSGPWTRNDVENKLVCSVFTYIQLLIVLWIDITDVWNCIWHDASSLNQIKNSLNLALNPIRSTELKLLHTYEYKCWNTRSDSSKFKSLAAITAS